MLPNASHLLRSSLALAVAVIIAGAAGAAVNYGPLAVLQDPAGGGEPTSAIIYWRTDTPTASNLVYLSDTESGPWTLAASDAVSTDRHEVLVAGLEGDRVYWVYVSSDGATSAPARFSTSTNRLTNGSFETWRTVSGQGWGAQEPDGWHGWETYPWEPGTTGYANHITIEMDRNTGVPTPPVKDLAHRASMDRGWRTCYGGLYQEVTGLIPGTYVVSGWVTWLFNNVTNFAGHRIDVLVKDGAHTAGGPPTGTQVVWEQDGSQSDMLWQYVQGATECATGTLTVYANLRADSPDGSSFVHFDGFRVAREVPSLVTFSNFTASYVYTGSGCDITIEFDTDIAATTQIDWGATASYGATTPLDDALVTHHTVQLTGVALAALPYHYRARVSAPGGISEVSSDQEFDAPLITVSQINALVDIQSGTLATVSWNSNYPTTLNRVHFRRTGDAQYTAAQSPGDPQALTSHSVVLAGLQLGTQYEYHVESGGLSVPGAVSSPDGIFTTPDQPGASMFHDFAMVGGSIIDGGDDVGPGHDWQRLMHYSHPLFTITGLGFSGWAQCQPNDPGQGPDIYDWSSVDDTIARAVPGKSRLGYYQMWGTSPEWAGQHDTPGFWEKFEKFVEEQVVYINQNYGEIDITFENEPNISRAPSGWNWADWYIYCLQHFYAGVHRANARTGIDNKVIAGNLSGGAAGGFGDLYARGLKNCSDILGIHPYPDNIRDGVKVADLALMHSIMENYGDGDKKIWVSEGWGSGRSAGFDRSSPLIPPTALEIENMWLGLVKGYDNLMTPREHWNPSYLWGIKFFCANDNWGAQGWRERAQPQKDQYGNITGFIVDGYWMTPDIAPYFWNGGMYDFYGNSKDALHLLFPGNGLVFMNCGFELPGEPPKAHLPHFWSFSDGEPGESSVCLDDVIFHGGRRSLRMTQEVEGPSAGMILQETAKRAVIPGAQYRARVWVKTDGTGASAGRMRMRFVSLDGATVSDAFFAPEASGNAGWVLIEVVAAAPAYASRVEVGLHMSGSGTVYFDDVTISMAQEAEVGVLKGYTLDEMQVPVPHSIVSSTTGGFSTVSDENGYYEMHGVASGTYDFICRKPGYVPFRASNQTVAAGKVSFVMFCMGIPKPGLAVMDVQADTSSAQPGDPIAVAVTVRNAGQYPVEISDVGLFVERGNADATGSFTILPDPLNPRTINAYTEEQFDFQLIGRDSSAGLDVSINAYAFGQEDRPNMLTNGGFDSELWNHHWSFGGGAQLSWMQDASDYYSAPNSLKCTITSDGNYTWNWANNWSAWGDGAMPAKPHTNYTLGCYHKDSTNINTTVNVFIQEYYYDGESWFYNGRRFVGLPKRDVWAHDSMIYQTGSPEETPGLYPTNRLVASVGPCTNNGYATGVTWWDDIYLKETGDWLADDRADSGSHLLMAVGCESLAEAYSKPVGTVVRIAQSLVVTAGAESFDGRVYAQTPDRAMGTLIVPAGGVAVPSRDDSIVVTGTIGEIDGEKALLEAGFDAGVSVDVPTPLATIGRSLAGSVLPHGLLMRAWGRVSYIAPDETWFLLDDGSAVPAAGGRTGIKVICSDSITAIEPPELGVYTCATGIASCEDDGAVAALRLRSQSDAQ